MTNYFCLLKSSINRLYSQANIDLTIAVLVGNPYNYAVNKILGKLPCKLCDVCVLGCECLAILCILPALFKLCELILGFRQLCAKFRKLGVKLLSVPYISLSIT